MPKVSVIIPVYNVEKYLGECLDSILGQTLKDIEVLCVDDGSTDDSAKILADYAARDARVKVFASPHAGAFRAREVGVKAAKGEFIHFMDADDLLAPTAFGDLCSLADRERLDQIVFASSVFCEKDISAATRKWSMTLTRYYSVPKAVAGRVMTGMELMSSLYAYRHFHVSPPLRLIRASVVTDNDYPFPDATSRADNYFTPLSLYYSKRACAITSRYYCRRVREDSITSAPNAPLRHARNLFVVIAAISEFPPFKRELENPDSLISHFIATPATELEKWLLAMPLQQRLDLLRDMAETLGPERCALVQNALAMALNGARGRPRSISGAFRFALRRVRTRLGGRDRGKWWI